MESRIVFLAPRANTSFSTRPQPLSIFHQLPKKSCKILTDLICSQVEKLAVIYDFQLCSHCPDCPAWWESVSVICAPYPPPHSAANIATHPNPPLPQHFNWQKHFSLGHIFAQPTLHSSRPIPPSIYRVAHLTAPPPPQKKKS